MLSNTILQKGGRLCENQGNTRQKAAKRKQAKPQMSRDPISGQKGPEIRDLSFPACSHHITFDGRRSRPDARPLSLSCEGRPLTSRARMKWKIPSPTGSDEDLSALERRRQHQTTRIKGDDCAWSEVTRLARAATSMVRTCRSIRASTCAGTSTEHQGSAAAKKPQMQSEVSQQAARMAPQIDSVRGCVFAVLPSAEPQNVTDRHISIAWSRMTLN